MRRLLPTEEGIQEAATMLRASRLIVFPTETFYGLGANALDPVALDAVFRLKQRDPSQPVALIAASEEQAFSLWQHVSEKVKELTKCYWPGPLTIVLPARESLPGALLSPYGVGARVSPHPTARRLAAALGAPLVATSANKTGCPPLQRAADIESILPGADAILEDDEGVLGGLPSTIITFIDDTPKVLRKGPLELF